MSPTTNWEEISRLSLSEGLEYWKTIYETKYAIEVVESSKLDEIDGPLERVLRGRQPMPYFERFVHRCAMSMVLNKYRVHLTTLSQKEYALLVVWDEKREEILGSVQILLVKNLDGQEYMSVVGTSHFAYLYSMAVAESARRTGIGSDLLSAAEFIAQMWGEKKIVLHAYKNNAISRAFYKKHGYEEIFFIKMRVTTPGLPAKTVVIGKELEPPL